MWQLVVEDFVAKDFEAKCYRCAVYIGGRSFMECVPFPIFFIDVFNQVNMKRKQTNEKTPTGVNGIWQAHISNPRLPSPSEEILSQPCPRTLFAV